ncbi:AraC family transcriptional regulator [Micromonospora sp. NPDC005220]|uniref:AraC family transcriptional regulator n=1 Tax=Micromonospora sp. NPDC005220 TaxID=3155589 RepID=UPI00339EE191
MRYAARSPVTQLSRRPPGGLRPRAGRRCPGGVGVEVERVPSENPTYPVGYLTDWRMTVAADMLAESTATVAAVARHLGYADALGFSAAFKRVHGMSPTGHRRLTRVDATAA